MLSLSSLLQRATPRWTVSEFACEFSELPVFDRAERQDSRDWLLLEGGLALLLSRCTERGARRRFPASLEAYRNLKRQMKDANCCLSLPVHTLNDLRHEIAGIADAVTCEAARRCMERCLAGVGARSAE